MGRTKRGALEVSVQVSGDIGKSWFLCGKGWGRGAFGFLYKRCEVSMRTPGNMAARHLETYF